MTRCQELLILHILPLAIRAQRYEELKKFVNERAHSMGLRDPIEIILYCCLQLKQELDLPLTFSSMLYPDAGAVGMHEEAAMAVNRLSDEVLLSRSDFWQARMRKQYPERVKVIEDEYTSLLMDNEVNRSVLDQLKHLPKRSGSHFGFACLLNYDILAASDPGAEGAYLCDIDSKVIQFFDWARDAMIEASNRESFIDRFYSQHKFQVLKDCQMKTVEEAFKEEMQRPGSWLSTEEGFLRIKKLYQQNVIHHLILDAASHSEAFQKQLPQNVRFQTVYVSNIPEWLLNHSTLKMENFQENMKLVIQPDTCFIDAFYPDKNQKGMGPPLRVTVGCIPSFKKSGKRKRI